MKIVSGMAKGDALVPIILLEAAVTGGRTYHSYKRGGFVEARERGTEEVLGAIFWLTGVSAFNKLGDLIGKKLLGLDNLEVGKTPKKNPFGLEKIDFDVAKDTVRDPFKNYTDIIEKQANSLIKRKKVPKISEKTLAAFKFTKIISSILITNAIIGFIVPKINQAITRKYQKNVKNIDKNSTGIKTDENFTGLTNKNNKTSFKGGIQNLLSITNLFENDARCKLLSTDVGVAGGRAINARNKHERREILFRDLASVYFYMFCKNHLASLLNLVENGRSTRLDAFSARKLDAHLRNGLKDKSLNAQEFEKLVLGTQNTIPENISKEVKSGIIKLDKFKELENNQTIRKIAEKMSKLQPEICNEAIITAEQLKDVYTGGLINDPRFLNKVFRVFSDDKSINPLKYFAEKDLRKVKQQMEDYVKDIIKKSKSKGENITSETLKAAKKGNYIKNIFNLGVGFAVSAYFLSTAIPKIQYWITKKQTGEDNFPGVQQYND